MNCPNCGTSLPDGAKFCYSCGRALAGGPTGAAPPPPPAAPAAPATPQTLNCPSCGAPLHPLFGEMVITCEYCGGSTSLSAGGWKEVDKHTMLTPAVTDPALALQAVKAALDVGFMHRKVFEESKIVEQKLSFVPFWVVPVSATTQYTYTDVAVGVGSTVGTIAAAELLGSALGGRRGGFMPVPILTGPTINPTRHDTISGQYEYPVVAVKGMSAYQPKDYEFALKERTFFDVKSIPKGSPVLNGDLGDDAAQHAAHAFVMQLQAEEAHKKHRMVSGLQTQVQVAPGELLHVPIWYFLLERAGQKSMLLVDAHAGKVIQTIGGNA
jgi:hypothetical protein